MLLFTICPNDSTKCASTLVLLFILIYLHPSLASHTPIFALSKEWWSKNIDDRNCLKLVNAKYVLSQLVSIPPKFPRLKGSFIGTTGRVGRTFIYLLKISDCQPHDCIVFSYPWNICFDLPPIDTNLYGGSWLDENEKKCRQKNKASCSDSFRFVLMLDLQHLLYIYFNNLLKLFENLASETGMVLFLSILHKETRGHQSTFFFPAYFPTRLFKLIIRYWF